MPRFPTMNDCLDHSGMHEPQCLTNALPAEGLTCPRFGSRGEFTSRPAPARVHCLA